MQRAKIRQLSIRGLLVVVAIAAGMALLVRTAFLAREAARSADCRGCLTQIGLGLHNYQSTHEELPLATTRDARGRTMHSWRMLLVPYLESQRIYNSYRLSEAWNGPNNSRIGALSVGYYACPTRFPSPSGGPALSNLTSYVALTGPGTLFPHDRHGSLTSLTPEELAETIVVVESVNQPIGWTEPRDLDLAAYAANPDDPTLPLPSSLHPTGVNVLMADGRTRSLSAEEVRRRLLAMAMAKRGGKRMDREKATSEGTRR